MLVRFSRQYSADRRLRYLLLLVKRAFRLTPGISITEVDEAKRYSFIRRAIMQGLRGPEGIAAALEFLILNASRAGEVLGTT
jgi:hypothetical protein